MSMVGYVVGYLPLANFVSVLTIFRLGDRHTENILMNEMTGACLHVDFNCIFDKVSEFTFEP